MPHDVESMFSVRQMPWHRQGQVLADWPGSWAEARTLAGLDWDPKAEPAYTRRDTDQDGQPIYEAIDGWQAITRSDTGQVLWVARDSYQIIDHTALGEIVEAVLAQPGVKWETAGSLNHGRTVWCLALLDEPINLPHDPTITLPYLAMTTRHGEPGACTLRATAVRIVCANTFRAAELEGESTGATFSFHHTRNWRDRLDEARAAVTGARQELAAYTQLAQQLLGTPITTRQRELFLASFIPAPPAGLATDRVLGNVEQARQAIRDILNSPTTAEINHTAYGLLQAAGEYLDHVRRSRSWETRLGRTLIHPEPLKAKALTLIQETITS